MKKLYHSIALLLVVLGTICLIRGDRDTFRHTVILGMLCNIYAEVITND